MNPNTTQSDELREALVNVYIATRTPAAPKTPDWARVRSSLECELFARAVGALLTESTTPTVESATYTSRPMEGHIAASVTQGPTDHSDALTREDAIGPVERALWDDADRPLAEFKEGDPGKHVQTLIPTPEWKELSKACQRRGVSLSLMLRVAARQHLAWLTAYRSPEEARFAQQSAKIERHDTDCGLLYDDGPGYCTCRDTDEPAPFLPASTPEKDR